MIGLLDLLNGAGVLPREGSASGAGLRITAVTQDSRDVRPGALFVLEIPRHGQNTDR